MLNLDGVKITTNTTKVYQPKIVHIIHGKSNENIYVVVNSLSQAYEIMKYNSYELKVVENLYQKWNPNMDIVYQTYNPLTESLVDKVNHCQIQFSAYDYILNYFEE